MWLSAAAALKNVCVRLPSNQFIQNHQLGVSGEGTDAADANINSPLLNSDVGACSSSNECRVAPSSLTRAGFTFVPHRRYSSRPAASPTRRRQKAKNENKLTDAETIRPDPSNTHHDQNVTVAPHPESTSEYPLSETRPLDLRLVPSPGPPLSLSIIQQAAVSYTKSLMFHCLPTVSTEPCMWPPILVADHTHSKHDRLLYEPRSPTKYTSKDSVTQSFVKKSLRELQADEFYVEANSHLSGLPCFSCHNELSACVSMNHSLVLCTACGCEPVRWQEYEPLLKLYDFHSYTPFHKVPATAIEQLTADYRVHQESMVECVLSTWESSVAAKHLYDTTHALLPQWKALVQAFKLEEIGPATFAHYNVGGNFNMGVEQYASIVFPKYLSYQSQPTCLSMTQLAHGGQVHHRIRQTTHSAKYHPGLFGWNTIKPSTRTLVLTSSEVDALAVYECTGLATCALPATHATDVMNGALLQQFETIYVWFRPDEHKWARALAWHTNPHRFHIVQSELSALEVLNKNGRTALKSHFDEKNKKMKCVLPKETFRLSGDLRLKLKQQILNKDAIQQGVAQFGRWPVLNKELGGFRLGEITVLSGDTGCGKTTFICEMVVDLLTQNVRTLFCSFEMPDERVLQWMLCQYKRRPVHMSSYLPYLDQYLDEFTSLPGGPIFLKSNQFRGMSAKQIGECIREQAAMCDIQHVVIDNLQFVVSSVADGDFNDQFSAQNDFLSEMRHMATDMQVHVTIVAHPRKDEKLSMRSLYGGARLSQEADTVLMLETVHPKPKKPTWGSRAREQEDNEQTIELPVKYLQFSELSEIDAFVRNAIKIQVNIMKNRFLGRKASNELKMEYDSDIHCHTIEDLRNLGGID